MGKVRVFYPDRHFSEGDLYDFSKITMRERTRQSMESVSTSQSTAKITNDRKQKSLMESPNIDAEKMAKA